MKTTNGMQDSGRAALLTKPVLIVDREGYEAVIAERDFHSTAAARHRVRMILGLFTIAITATLVGFVGGFWAAQDTNGESFKAACSRVVDETLKDAKCPGGNVAQIEDVSTDPMQKARR